MIECEGCGSNLTLKDEICPFCGRPNQDALEHIKQMKYYRQIFESAKEDITTKTMDQSGLHIRQITVTVLFIMAFIMLILSVQTDQLKRSLDYSYGRRHRDEILLKIDQYMVENNPVAIGGLYGNYHPYERGTSEWIGSVSSSYCSIKNYLLKLSLHSDDVYDSQSSTIQNISYQTSYFMRNYQECMEKGTEEQQMYVNQLKKQIDELFMYITNLKKEDLDTFYSLNEQEMATMIKENLR